MHDGGEVVRRKKAHRSLLVEVVFLRFSDIIELHDHVTVSVVARLFMPQTDKMAELMNDHLWL